MLPGAIAVLSPLLIGFVLGPEALGGFLAGATVSGVLMGMFQNNSGGAWDNAKKSFEQGVEIDGEIYYKNSEPHKASVTGDTVGDPFKDTSGPSMNILIKLMSIVSLVIAPTLAQIHKGNAQVNTIQKTIEVKYTATDSSTKSAANISISGDDKELTTLIDALKKDGVVTGNDVKIEINNDKLIVNGKELTDEQFKKYQPYFNKSGNGKINIKVDVDKK